MYELTGEVTDEMTGRALAGVGAAHGPKVGPADSPQTAMARRKSAHRDERQVLRIAIRARICCLPTEVD